MKFITTSTSQRQEESWKMSEILFFHWDIDKNCSNSRGTGKGNNAGNIFQCSGELTNIIVTRSGTERRWKKRCSGALSIISVTLSKAFRSAPLDCEWLARSGAEQENIEWLEKLQCSHHCQKRSAPLRWNCERSNDSSTEWSGAERGNIEWLEKLQCSHHCQKHSAPLRWNCERSNDSGTERSGAEQGNIEWLEKLQCSHYCQKHSAPLRWNC